MRSADRVLARELERFAAGVAPADRETIHRTIQRLPDFGRGAGEIETPRMASRLAGIYIAPRALKGERT